MWDLRSALYDIIKPGRASEFQLLTFNSQLFCRANGATNPNFNARYEKVTTLQQCRNRCEQKSKKRVKPASVFVEKY